MCFLIGLSSLSTYAETVGDLNYSLDKKTAKASVTGLSSSETSTLAIPSTIEYDGIEFTVTSIGNRAFENYYGLTEIIIPNSITSIGEYAFNGCSGIKSLILEEGEEELSLGYNYYSSYLGKGLFYDCPLENVYIGRNLSYYSSSSSGYSPFYNKTMLTELTIVNSVTSINDYLFSGCSGLSEIYIPNSVTSIGNNAFNGCSGIKRLILEDGEEVLSIDSSFSDSPLESIYLGRSLSYSSVYQHSPFKNKTTLTELTIGNSVTSINDYLFSGCSGLSEINIPNSVTSIEYSAFENCSGITEVTIPNSVTSIRNYAFNGCSGIKILILEDGEKSLSLGCNYYYGSSNGKGLFYDCPLESVYIGRNLSYYASSYYGYSPFYNKTTLISLTIGNSVTSIEGYAFSGCSGLSEICIPNSVTSIGYSAFENCSGLTEIIIPNSVTSIGNNAFENCSSLTEVSIPNSVTSIGEYAFNGCSGIKSLILEDGEEKLSLEYNYHGSYLGKGLFYDSPLESVYIGRDLSYSTGSSNGYSPFYNKTTLTELTIGNSVTTINDYLFSGCSDLSEVIIPNSVTSIGENAFENCSGLTALTIGNSVATIGEYAFKDCSGLTEVTIPNSVTLIENYAFNGCSGIKSLILEDGEEKLSLGYNYYYSYGGKGLFYDSPLESVYIGRDLSYSTSSSNGYSPFYNKTMLTELTISNSVTSINDYLFSGCSGLSEVTIPNSVTSIGYSAFNNCGGLTEVSIPNSVTSIGSLAFNSCIRLTALTIGNSVTSIGQSAFNNCGDLIEVSIPNSVISIEYNAFGGCSGITSLIIKDGEEVLSLDSSFSDCPLESVYLGRSLSYSNNVSPFYKKTTLTTLTIGNSVTSINDYLFEGCSGLTEINIPSSVASIGNNAFKDCSGIRNLIIEDGEDELSIGYYYGYSVKGFFADCPLENIYLGRDLTYRKGSNYGYSPFYNQTSLTTLTVGKQVTSLGESLFKECSNVSSLESYLIDINGIENCGLSKALEVCIQMGDDINEDIYSTNLLYFDKVSVKTGENKYAFVTAPEFFEFTNCLTSKDSCFLVEIEKDCGVIDSNNSEYVFFNGVNISDKISSETEFVFIPSEYHAKNIFDAINYGELKVVTVNSAGNLFNEVGLQDIEKIERLKIKGDLNGTDIMTINRMSGLKMLDISESNIVEGGITYRDNLKTEDDVIGSYFFNDLQLDIVILPASAKKIGRSAFYNKSSLRVVEIGGATETIGSWAFSGCSGLSSIVIPNSVTSIGDNVFYYCSALIRIDIPNSVEKIGNYAFEGCTSLSEISIPASVTSIGNYAFKGCSGIKSLILEDGEKKLSLGYNYYSSYSSSDGKGLFSDCPLETIYLGRDLSYSVNISYGYSPFYNKTTLIDLTIGNSVTSISENAFRECSGLTEVIIPNSVTTIGGYSFMDCTELKRVDISDSVTLINYYAFSGCSSLGDLTIGDSVIRIDSNAFYRCISLKEVVIPNSVTSIEYAAFYECTGLKDLTIGSSVTSIGNRAFSGCTSLTSINFPDSVTTIGYDAFSGCTAVTEIVIPNLVTEIESDTFSGCTSLKSISFPDSLTSIGSDAFSGCSQLSEVILPASVTNIGYGAFGKCKGITDVYSMNTTPPVIQTSTFDSEVEETATLHVKKGSMVHYWLDPVWKEFNNINEDVLYLEAIPAATYGDSEIDLSQYAPEGVALRYESSNSDVVEIDGNIMRIVGAGAATVGALLEDESGTPMKLMGQMRQFKVDKADLKITVAEITIEEGDPLPDFSYIAEGLKYHDTLADINELPQPICDVDVFSVVGEYPIYFTEGHDRNYNIETIPSRVIVSVSSGIESNAQLTIDYDSEVEVYNLDGILVYKGSRREAQLQKGVYIVRQGQSVIKIMVK